MIRKLFIILIVLGILGMAFTMVFAGVPGQPGMVRVVGSQLKVQKRLPDGRLDVERPYIIKGVTWQPATWAPSGGPDPDNLSVNTPYGFFFDWPGHNGAKILSYWLKRAFTDIPPKGQKLKLKQYQIDIALMQQMNVNTVRVYTVYTDLVKTSGGPHLDFTEILDEFYNKGIMVIMTVAIAKEDFDSLTYRAVVTKYKDHPAVLMWSLGNEWNYNKYYGFTDVAAARMATNDAAAWIKNQDSIHPVSSILGDRFDLRNDPPGTVCPVNDEVGSDIPTIVAYCPNVEVWGINVYRGYSFGDLFTQWQGVSSKPFYISEFGTDSFYAVRYSPFRGAPPCDNKVRCSTGKEKQQDQSGFIIGLWQQIRPQLSALNADKMCLGGLVHEFNDELWKVGNFHTGLGYYRQQDYFRNTSYHKQNSEGFLMPGCHPDGVANEEYFGVVDANRNPKKAFKDLQLLYRSLTVR